MLGDRQVMSLPRGYEVMSLGKQQGLYRGQNETGPGSSVPEPPARISQHSYGGLRSISSQGGVLLLLLYSRYRS